MDGVQSYDQGAFGLESYKEYLHHILQWPVGTFEPTCLHADISNYSLFQLCLSCLFFYPAHSSRMHGIPLGGQSVAGLQQSVRHSHHSNQLHYHPSFCYPPFAGGVGGMDKCFQDSPLYVILFGSRLCVNGLS